MAAADFLHQENPPTCAGIEPATLGAEGQRQTNHVSTHAAILFYFTLPSEATGGLLSTDFAILRHGQVTKTEPELCPSLSSNIHTTPTEDFEPRKI
ncbi:hypothetical protein TNCV_4324721 [Trichonephila clavipes]|nr:hypothetical protein TNCV_4324721 [Trichonephila clavipes]